MIILGRLGVCFSLTLGFIDLGFVECRNVLAAQLIQFVFGRLQLGTQRGVFSAQLLELLAQGGDIFR